MIPLLLSALLAPSPQGSAPPTDLPRLLLPAQLNVGVPLDRPDLYDALMVCTPLGPARSRPLPEDGYLAVQPVRVEDSRAFAPGTVVEVYYPAIFGPRDSPRPEGTVIDQTGAPPVGARVLLVARAAQGGVLRVPDLSTWEAPEKRTLALGPDAPPSVWGETFFLTGQARLAPKADPKERYVASLAAAVVRTPDDNAAAIAEFMWSFAGRRGRFPTGRPEDWLSRAVTEAVAGAKPYHRALVDHTLNRMGYWGYVSRFSRDLAASVEDAGAFPDGVPNLEFSENLYSPMAPKDLKYDPPRTYDELLAITKRAKSPTLAVAFLNTLKSKPADADVRALSRFLDSPDPRLRWAFVERLAAWTGEAAPEKPRPVLNALGFPRSDARGRTLMEYPGLDAAVLRWKARLRGGRP